MRFSRALFAGTLAVIGRPLSAQTVEQVAAAAVSITQANIASHVSVLAADSMRGRDTPSPELEVTARYIAAQFAAAGLTPEGKTWIQRYPIPVRFDFATSRLVFAGSGKQAIAGFSTVAHLVTRTLSDTLKAKSTGVLLVAGPHTSASVDQASRRGKIVLYVAPSVPTGSSPTDTADLESRLAEGNTGVVLLSPEDSVAFTRRLREGWHQPVVEIRRRVRSRATSKFESPPWIVHVRPDAVAGMADLLAAVGLDLMQLRAETAPVIRELPGLAVTFEPRLMQTPGDSVTAPNVVAKIDGRDPRLKKEYVIVLAHMDHLGFRSGRLDSIANGADDNASGVAGLVALARAFNQPGMHPRRTLLFAAVSGGAKELWGSRSIAGRFQGLQQMGWLWDGAPQVTAVINLDMIGRLLGDTLAVAGLGEVEWPTVPAWIAAAHPKLSLILADGGTLFQPSSDHFPFVKAWMPSLSFQNGRHEEGPVANDEPSQFDMRQTARILQFVLHVGVDLANAEKRPQWTKASRQRLLGSAVP